PAPVSARGPRALRRHGDLRQTGHAALGGRVEARGHRGAVGLRRRRGRQKVALRTDLTVYEEEPMKNTVISHAAFGCATALLASSVTYLALAGWPESMSPSRAHAQSQPAASAGVRQTELFKTTMNDVLGRVVTVRRTERDPGNGSG